MTKRYISSNPSDVTKYAKRPRHKTRPDKYEYRGERNLKKSVKNRGRMNKGFLGNAMFKADNVDAHRVTLKPETAELTFSRSKISAPLAGRDLPDLTFAKMGFLSKDIGDSRTFQDGSSVNECNSRGREESSYASRHSDCEILKNKHRRLPRTAQNPDSKLFSRPFRSKMRHNIVKSTSVVDGTRGNEQYEGDLSDYDAKARRKVEEYLSTLADTDHKSLVPWSSSPPHHHSPDGLSILGNERIAALTQANQQIGQFNFGQSLSQADDATDRNEDAAIIADLTKIMLHRQNASYDTGGKKQYSSLEDLKRILNADTERAETSESLLHHDVLQNPGEGKVQYLKYHCMTPNSIELSSLEHCHGVGHYEEASLGDDRTLKDLTKGAISVHSNNRQQPQMNTMVETCGSQDKLFQPCGPTGCVLRRSRQLHLDPSSGGLTTPNRDWAGQSPEDSLDAFDLELLDTIRTDKRKYELAKSPRTRFQELDSAFARASKHAPPPYRLLEIESESRRTEFPSWKLGLSKEVLGDGFVSRVGRLSLQLQNFGQDFNPYSINPSLVSR